MSIACIHGQLARSCDRCEDADTIRRLEAELTGLHDRLATIIDERFGVQPVMSIDDLLTLLERRMHSERIADRRAERLRIADLAEALAKEHLRGARGFRSIADEFKGEALEDLADELRAEGGGT